MPSGEFKAAELHAWTIAFFSGHSGITFTDAFFVVMPMALTEDSDKGGF